MNKEKMMSNYEPIFLGINAFSLVKQEIELCYMIRIIQVILGSHWLLLNTNRPSEILSLIASVPCAVFSSDLSKCIKS